MSPIKDPSRYPHDWKDISLSIKERAGWRCECAGECGAHEGERCERHHGDTLWTASGWPVILTTAHLDHDPGNNDDGNLKAMCEGCHNRYDRPHRSANARKTRERKRGLIPLFEEELS